MSVVMDVGTKLRFQRCWQNVIKLVCCLSNNWNCGISILQWRLVLKNTVFYLQLKYNLGNNNVNYTQNGHSFNVKQLKLNTLNAASLMLTRVSLLTLSYSPLSRMKFWRIPNASESIQQICFGDTTLYKCENSGTCCKSRDQGQVVAWAHCWLVVTIFVSNQMMCRLFTSGNIFKRLFLLSFSSCGHNNKVILLNNDSKLHRYKWTLKLNRIIFENKGFRLNWTYRFHIIQLSCNWVQMILHGNC